MSGEYIPNTAENLCYRVNTVNRNLLGWNQTYKNANAGVYPFLIF